RRDVRVPLLHRPDPVDRRVHERVRPMRDHRLPSLAVAGRDLGRVAGEVDVVVHDGGAAGEAREGGDADLLGRPRGVRVGAVDGRFEDDRGAAGVAHRPADGRTTRPGFPASVRAPSTWTGVPLTTTCCIPTGWSAVRRSASAGKSRTRRTGPGATVAGSNTATSAHIPGRRYPRSAKPKMSACCPLSLRIACSIGMTSRPRTQFP